MSKDEKDFTSHMVRKLNLPPQDTNMEPKKLNVIRRKMENVNML